MEFKVGDYFEFNSKKFSEEFTPYGVTCEGGLFKVVSKDGSDLSHLDNLSPSELYTKCIRDEFENNCRVEVIIPIEYIPRSKGRRYEVASVFFTKIQDFRANYRIRKYNKETENGN